MTYDKISWTDIGAWAEIGAYAPDGGVGEWHVMLHVEARGEVFSAQLQRLKTAEQRLTEYLAQPAGEKAHAARPTAIMKRYFLSDATNQQPQMGEEPEVSVSYIQQPPLDGSKVAQWIYFQRGVAKECRQGTVIASHNGYRHIWKMGMISPEGTSYTQTERVLADYTATLADYGATLADNCIRTWFFVRDVDTQYAGMVKARMANFISEGLTPETHYIASTGIQGLPAETKAIIQLGAYAITGFEPSQQRYLYALSHLNRTIEYGVTFERGTVMEYGDRAHAFISGTASIDAHGQVVHVGDIVRQTVRMWENVEALLAEAAMTMADCAQIIVYLRDVADYDVVRQLFEDRYPSIPIVYTLAPVCRPSWLIEMECVAVAQRCNPAYRDY